MSKTHQASTTYNKGFLRESITSEGTIGKFYRHLLSSKRRRESLYERLYGISSMVGHPIGRSLILSLFLLDIDRCGGCLCGRRDYLRSTTSL